MEENPFGGFSMNNSVRNRLRSVGVDAAWGNRSYAFTHAKFVVVDGQIAWLMTANLTKSAFDKNREILVRTRDQLVIDNLVRVFWADRRRGPCPPGALVLGPLNGRQALVSFLGSAQRTIDVVSEVFDDGQVAQVLKSLARQGVKVRVLVASPDEIAANGVLRSWMSGTRVEVRYLKTPYLHAKYLVVDERVAYVGSANLSTGSLDDNREVGILTSSPEVVPTLLRTFECDWSAGTR
jgi:phosphatidylserine/phosphatidylglycerophosphate/cardiolipin synthase-like enzyme